MPTPTPARGPLPPSVVAPPLTSVPVGEQLEYRVFWWGIYVADATLTTEPEKSHLKLSLRARSNRYLDAFYPARAELTSWIDPKAGSPRRFQALVKRRWRRHESVVTFDDGKRTAFHQLPKGRTATVSIGSTTQDGLSLLYYVRTVPFEVGQGIPLEVTADGKNWPLTGKIVRTGSVSLKGLKDYPAIEGQVQLAYPVPFFHGAKARVWFSNDGERIPLLAKISSRIGPVTVVLTHRAISTSSS